MAAQSKTAVAVIASLATGIVVALASGELRASRDPGLELFRANELLAERLAEQHAELSAAREELAALRIAMLGGKPNKPGASPPSDTSKSAAQAAAEERIAFRAKALEALKPELEAIDAAAAAAKAKFDKHTKAFDEHTHEYEVTSHGWARLDTMLDEAHFDVLRATYLDHWVAIRDPKKSNATFSRSTTKPK
jgi:hypothetical protein